MGGTERAAGQVKEGNFASVDTIRKELDNLDNFKKNGDWWHITTEMFPNIPPDLIALQRFWAFDAFIDGVHATLKIVNDEEKRENIERWETELIIERNDEFASYIGDRTGPIDHEKMKYQIDPMHPGERVQWLNLFVALGFPESVNEDTFPELRLIPISERLRLELRLLRNSGQDIKDMISKEESRRGGAGFVKLHDGEGEKVDELREKLAKVEETYQNRLKDYISL